ncbi:MAG: ATP-binding protein [Bacteroidetes bacterium]|nr:ATP-binding protein [Bacteroidota bacterium]
MNQPFLVTITGPESTGKSALTEALGAHLAAAVVADVSRAYVAALQQPYTAIDILNIAEQIIMQEDKALGSGAKWIISDNDLINIRIWLQYYEWHVPLWLQQQIAKRKSALYLLCATDLPWVPDPQRQNEHDRLQLYAAFEQELQALSAPYRVVQGTGAERLQVALAAIHQQMEQ